MRRLDRFDTFALRGSEGAFSPVFSPDGQWVAYTQKGALRKVRVSADASPVVLLESLGPALQITWPTADTIFSPAATSRFAKCPRMGVLPSPSRVFNREPTSIIMVPNCCRPARPCCLRRTVNAIALRSPCRTCARGNVRRCSNRHLRLCTRRRATCCSEGARRSWRWRSTLTGSRSAAIRSCSSKGSRESRPADRSTFGYRGTAGSFTFRSAAPRTGC